MKDGKYVVVNVEADGGQYNTLPKCSDDTVGGKSIGGFLRDKLKQKQYQLQFKEDFVIVKDIEENEDTILALTNDADGDYYSTQLSKGEDKEKINIQLRPSRSKSGLVLIVDLNVPWNIRYRPAQVGGKFVGGIPCGRAICYLSKLD
ncbi:hypothetical protein [Pedobacter sp. Leaf132]|uniref:hypothetical protein n=1 Tax=Pedobacter sp. Leaf132 TaxID=2876557 RepID=UPI001E2A8C48|nr:hypothetical protein [Pedobacter sp. Leaf132]